MSEILIQIGLAVPEARIAAPPIQAYPAAESSSAQMVGTAVATMVWFNAAMNCALTRAAIQAARRHFAFLDLAGDGG